MALTNDMAVAQAPKLALSQHWWFRLLLLVGALFIPPITEVRFASADTSKLIASVLSHPLIVEVSALLPLAKVLLLLPSCAHSGGGRQLPRYCSATTSLPWWSPASCRTWVIPMSSGSPGLPETRSSCWSWRCSVRGKFCSSGQPPNRSSSHIAVFGF